MQSIPPLHANRSVISSRTNVGFIPATGLAPHGLAVCNAVVPWQATSPLCQSPRGEPFGPSTTRAAYYALCRLLPFVQLGSRLTQLAWVNSLAPTAWQISQSETQNVPRVDAGFIKHAPRENRGLCCYVPARPERATPQIRFVHLFPVSVRRRPSFRRPGIQLPRAQSLWHRRRARSILLERIRRSALSRRPYELPHVRSIGAQRPSAAAGTLFVPVGWSDWFDGTKPREEFTQATRITGEVARVLARLDERREFRE